MRLFAKSVGGYANKKLNVLKCGEKMSSSSPRVSVIIPCYNYGHYLADAINSVIHQNVKEGVEIIVVDDGSSDNTSNVAQQFGSTVKYIYQDNQGLSAARNTGLQAAKGDFIVFLDADDLLSKGNLNAHLDNFHAQADLDISVCHSVQMVEESGECNMWNLKASHLDIHLCHSNIAPVHTFMLRAQSNQQPLLFDSSFGACEDYDYWLRMAAMGKRFAANPNTFVIYRMHENSLSTQNTQQLAYDSALHFKIGKLLETAPNFPRAGKFYGWLAYASGCIGNACSLSTINPQYASKLLEESAKAILKAAACTKKGIEEEPYLINTANYYAASYIELARLFDHNAPGPFNKALAFLSHRYPNLAKSKMEALNIKKNILFTRIVCDTGMVQQNIKNTKNTISNRKSDG